MATNPRQIVLRSDIPDWAIEWLLRRKFADEVEAQESGPQADPELRAFQPEEADYVLGESGPKTDKPE